MFLSFPDVEFNSNPTPLAFGQILLSGVLIVHLLSSEVIGSKPLQKAPFCPISVSGSKSGIFDLNLNKIEHFSKVSDQFLFFDKIK
jgi:hypothetical protein